jgi:hypothetical protein
MPETGQVTAWGDARTSNGLAERVLGLLGRLVSSRFSRFSRISIFSHLLTVAALIESQYTKRSHDRQGVVYPEFLCHCCNRELDILPDFGHQPFEPGALRWGGASDGEQRPGS